MCGMSLGDGVDAVDPRFKNELTRDAAPPETLPPPPLPGVSCARGLANASAPALLAGAPAVLVLFVRRSPSASATCCPVRAAGTAGTTAAAAEAAAAAATDTSCAGDTEVIPSLGGITIADGATVAAAAGGSVSSVSESVASASVAGPAATEGSLFWSPSA